MEATPFSEVSRFLWLSIPKAGRGPNPPSPIKFAEEKFLVAKATVENWNKGYSLTSSKSPYHVKQAESGELIYGFA
ncbi:hypothetical protein Leryth_016904 [Lithospermum erythrorhizon]|nr:hypothetical protein Leryth_016904 [Lithospermum erythrorhizon]